VALADVRASGAQEVVGKLVARVSIANAHWLPYAKPPNATSIKMVTAWNSDTLKRPRLLSR
jgi:hypothetical protein